jgi:hypothetical protein
MSSFSYITDLERQSQVFDYPEDGLEEETEEGETEAGQQ